MCAVLAGAACADDRLTGPGHADTRPVSPSLAAATAPSFALAATPAAPELPRVYMNTAWVTPRGRRLAVPAGKSLQAAIDSARAGDVILLQPGATYVGNFRLRAKPASTSWITIMTDASLPAPGTRVSPASAAGFAKIVTYDAEQALRTDRGAHHWRVAGVEIAAGGGVRRLSSALVSLGDGDEPQTTLDGVPNHLILDRVYVHGHANLDFKRCVTLNSATSAVVDSYLSECHSRGQDSQAIIGWNGPGPFKIVNNYLEGAGENVMFGGGRILIPGLVPSDIEIRGNYFYKPLAWRDVWAVKNLFELKAARRVLVEGNVFENSWKDAQIGYAILLKSSGVQDNPWVVTEDVTFRYNEIRNAASGIALLANDAWNVPAGRIRVEQNLFAGIGVSNGTSSGRAISVLGEVHDVVLAHNTVIPNSTTLGTAIVLGGGSVKGNNVVFRDNVLVGVDYMMTTSGWGEGTRGLDHFYTSWSFDNNVLVGASASYYPASNFFPRTMADVGFVDMLVGNYRLAPTSRYWHKGTDGMNPGVIMDQLLPRIAKATTGD